ncbi:MAG: hypothetical protein KKA60_12360 [Proteobacteria bacterium]|nr:hypothetical protein [Pseudomonadota bacterium]
MPENDIHMADLVNMADPRAVMNEVKILVRLMVPDFPMFRLDRVYHDVADLYGGRYPGFRAYNTEYHDLRHTMDGILAIARMVHGAWGLGRRLSLRDMELALIATLMHDTGYIQSVDDNRGTGAKYTLSHVQRSIDFMRSYFSENRMDEEEFQDAAAMLRCTGLGTDIGSLEFSGPDIGLCGKMLGAADILGQMADRTYLEKLLFLYYEFKEAGISGYDSERDLLEKTLGFYDMTKKRLARDLDQVDQYLKPSFAERYGVARNLYEEAIEKNIAYLRHVLENHDHRDLLRRGGVVNKLDKKGL